MLPVAVCISGCDRQAPTAAEFAPAAALVQRITPEWAASVRFCHSPGSAVATLDNAGGKLLITAPNRAEAIRAYGYYLRQYAHVHLSWNGDNRSAAAFVLPENKVEVPPTRPNNYAFNYCTLSYSGAHWDRARWTRELDILALNGYRYALVTAGLENVWQKFLKETGCSDRQIAGFIPNPAYSAWWLMGNLEGEGGPVHPDIIRREAELGRFIVQRMRELGLEPVLQGYVGLLPHNIDPALVRGTLLNQGEWVAGYNRPSVLEPTSPDFPKLAERWYRLLEEQYGYRAKAFAGDLFHEGGNKEGADLKGCAAAVQQAMQKASPGSCWYLQAWARNPSEALLSGLDREHTRILLLDKNLTPEHDPFYRDIPSLKRPQVMDFPIIWSELANFGGNHGLYGSLPLLEHFSADAVGEMGRTAQQAVGMGLLSEGVETNPLYYDMLTERLNRPGGIINRRDYLKRYVLSRYGVEDEQSIRALELLAESVYAPDAMREGCLESILCARPSLHADRASTWSSAERYYDPAAVEQAAHCLLEAGQRLGLESRETFRYDMADVTRQVLADRARVQLSKVEHAYEEADLAGFFYESDRFLSLLQQSADILETSEHFLLGRYLAGAEEKAGQNPEARSQMRRSLLRLLTTWSHGNTALNDYAHRQLAEMMRHYYLPRWQAYLDDKALDLMSSVTPPRGSELGSGSEDNNGEDISYLFERNDHVDRIQNNFPTADIPLLQSPRGNVLETAARILNTPA